MTKLLIYPAVVFSIILIGLTIILKQNYQVEFSQNWLLYSHSYFNNGFHSTSLYALNLDTEEQYRLAKRLAGNFLIKGTWSPDGRWVYYNSSDANANLQLCRASLVQTNTECVITEWETPANWDYQFPLRWTADGQWIIHHRGFKHSYALYKMRPDGSEAQRLTEENAEFVTISPDSQWVYYTFKNSDGLYRISLQTNERHNVSFAGYANFLGWSADGQWLYFNYSDATNAVISRVRADGQSFEQLTSDDPPNSSFEEWSPDHTQFIYSLADSGFYLYDLKNDTTRYLFNGASNTRMRFSQDNKALYVYQNLRGAYQLSLTSDPSIRWLVEAQDFRINHWQADGSGFYYQLQDGEPTYTYHFYYYDLATQQSILLGEWEPNETGNGPSPDLILVLPYYSLDGKYIIVQIYNDKEELCELRVADGHKSCLNSLPGQKLIYDWMPPYQDKIWHPNTLLFLVSGLIVGYSGAGFYLRQRNL